MSFVERFSLEGRLAVVTGGTGLYGLPFSRALAQAGAHVVLTSRSPERADETAGVLRREGLKASGAGLDLANPDDVTRFAARLQAEHGAPDVLVNNAVHRAGGALDSTTAQDWDATSAVNSRGLFLVTQALAAAMRARGSGSIVNIGSIYGLVGPELAIYEGTGMASPAFYAFDKAGMVGLTRYLACELWPAGVRVNCLSPGGLRTEHHDPRFVAAYSARVPLGRMAVEDDVTGALVFLASDASAYVTGTVIPVDGGWTAR